MTEVQVQTSEISIYPVRSSGASSQSSQSSYSSSFGSARRDLTSGDQSALSEALSEALERLLLNQTTEAELQIARLAVKTGIPSAQRAATWPLLLRTHPYVLNPCLANDFPVAPEGFSEKRVQGDLRRLVQKTCRQLEPEAQDAVLSNLRTVVCAFLAKYGLQYESGYAWVAWSLRKCMDAELCPEVFEHAMLVFLHTSSTAQPRGPGENDNADSISQFMGVFRQNLPELTAHFDQEFMLNFFLGEEWLMWWIKWFGAKAWALPDLARTWDIYFGYREEPGAPFGRSPSASLGSPSTSPLGTSPVGSGSASASASATASPLTPGLTGSTLGSPSEVTLHAASAAQPAPAQAPPLTPLALPAAQANVEPRKLHIFVCLAVMKANSHKLMELDQSEAHHLLTHVPPTKNFEALLIEAYGMMSRAG